VQIRLFHKRGRAFRRLIIVIAAVNVLLVLFQRGPGDYASGFPPIGGTDFVQYWSAARLLVGGGNPYDPATLFSMEQSVGWPHPESLLMWNPPYALALVLPVAHLPFNLATLAWLALQLELILGSGVLSWRYFAREDDRFRIGLLVALAFVPTLLALRLGQISPWLLVGVVGFLWAERSKRDFLAGGALALLMIKPQVAYLFLAAALWWAWRSRRWRVLAGGLGALLIGSGLVFLVSPGIVANYLAAMTRPPLHWLPPTIGTWLRLLFRPAPSWLQFLPSVVGLLGLAVWLWRRRGPWRWQSVASPLLLASFLTTSFGWTYDQIILLPVVVDLVSRLRWVSKRQRLTVLGALALFQVTLLLQNHWQIGDQYSIWHGFGLAGLYLWVAAQQPDVEGATSLEGRGNRDMAWDSNRGYRRYGQRVRP
jgi:hypothetical protein